MHASFAGGRGYYGSPHDDFIEWGECVSRKRIIRLKQEEGLIARDYREVLAAHGVACSISRRGNCYDNAVMEAFFSTVKSEIGAWFESHGDAKARLFDYANSNTTPSRQLS